MKLKINEIFNSIQGEGRYQGQPVTFIRLSGCTRKCDFCDTKYHTKINKDISPKSFAKGFKPKGNIIVFTGGEPLLQLEAIRELSYELPGNIEFHLESNGDLIEDWDWVAENIDGIFDYICISPKDSETAERVYNILNQGGWVLDWDIKVVTDLIKIGTDMLQFSTMLMPLTLYKEIDKIIRRDVWNYCITTNKFYSARLHVEVFGNKKGI